MADDDLLQRTTFASLRPAARLAVRAGFALKEMKHFIELAYYQEAKLQGLKMKEISELMSVSMSKVGLLSKELKEHFVEPETEHGIARQILSLLWAAPLTEARIAAALDSWDADEVSAALHQLEDEGRIVREEGRTDYFALAASAHRLSTVPWMAKVDGLNTLMDNVFGAVRARFFEADDRAFVRNVAFRVRPEDLPRLRELYENEIFPLILELDEAVEADGESVPIRLSMLWAPDGGNDTGEDS